MRPDLRVIVALVALAIALGANAFGADFDDCDEAASLLLAPDLRSDQARASEASDLLSAERTRKLADLSAAIVDLGLHASVQASPLKFLRTAGTIGRDVRDWNDRTSTDDEALALLEPGARAGNLDAESFALYSSLERRESAARVSQLLSDAESAIGSGDLRRTRRTLDRALSLEPGSSRADRLLDEIDEREWLATGEEDVETGAADASEKAPIAAWEVQLGTELLVDDFTRARELGPESSSDAAFARATARYLDGNHEDALDELRRISRGDDAAARRAAEFLADPTVNPEGAFDAELRLYRTRRALGWLGGEELADTAVPSTSDALSLSRSGYRAWQGSYRAWRHALRPANLVIDAPARAWRSWQPDGDALHRSAERYLELVPDGARAPEAAAWLESLGAQERQDARVSPFRDGVLELPHAQTKWSRLSSTRIVVARAALALAAPELVAGLADDEAPAFLLALDTRTDRRPANGTALSKEQSLDVLGRLASGVERSTLTALGDGRTDLLASLRRLDGRIRDGRTLVASAWTPEAAAGIDALGAAFVDGDRSRTVGDILVQRQGEALVAERQLRGGDAFCRHEAACIDLQRDIDPVFFANSGSNGAVGVGARANFENAHLSFEVGASGPHASLVIPVARWLGIGRFFPVEARLEVGLDGVTAGPYRDDHAGDVGEPSL